MSEPNSITADATAGYSDDDLEKEFIAMLADLDDDQIAELADIAAQMIEENTEDAVTAATRFDRLVAKLRGRGVRDPKALAAWIGRKKYGKSKFQEMAARGRARTAAAMAGKKVTASVLTDAVVASVNTDGTLDIVTDDGARFTVPENAVQLRDDDIPIAVTPSAVTAAIAAGVRQGLVDGITSMKRVAQLEERMSNGKIAAG